ncbi:MAG: transposase family protein [Daejeonella sp.]|nr:transposase family protein [Daejeonella sp.]
MQQIPLCQRNKVKEITLDLAGNMSLIAKKVSPRQLRFHVQQLATEALQEIRIKHRWEAIDAENEALEIAKNLSSILKQSDLS